jgi:hypothetical protein
VLPYPNNFKEAYYADGYLADAYNTSPDCSMSTFFETDLLFDEPMRSRELAPEFLSEAQSCFNTTLSAISISSSNTTATASSLLQQHHNPAPFGLLNETPSGFIDNPSLESGGIFPDSDCSCTTSLCSNSTGATVSPHILKHQPLPLSIECDEEPMPKRPLRKRGRPRLDRSDEAELSSASLGRQYKQCRGRVPHNQVERKYREGLDLELERLRRAVPTLPQSGEDGVMGQPKPSKAIVLTAAIDYIKRIEKERDALWGEIERIKYAQGNKRHNTFDNFVTE